MIEVALVRLRVRRPEGDAGVLRAPARPARDPGRGRARAGRDGARARARPQPSRSIDWAATGEWIGAKLTLPDGAASSTTGRRARSGRRRGEIEVYDVDGLRERLDERRGGWSSRRPGWCR